MKTFSGPRKWWLVVGGAVSVLVVALAVWGVPSRETSVQGSLPGQLFWATELSGVPLTLPQGADRAGLYDVVPVSWERFSELLGEPYTSPEDWVTYNSGTNIAAVLVGGDSSEVYIATAPVPVAGGESAAGSETQTDAEPADGVDAGVGGMLTDAINQNTLGGVPGMLGGHPVIPASPVSWLVDREVSRPSLLSSLSTSGSFVTFGFPILLVGAAITAMWFFSRRANRVGAEFVGTPAAIAAVPTSVNFSHVAGADDAVTEISEVTTMHTDPGKFARFGVKPPRGVLLSGPPGTGKTLLARAVAGSAGLPFYAATGSDFVEMYVGVGASRVRTLFAEAAKHPEGAVVFIDELETLGRSRSSSSANGTANEQEGALNSLLVAMDGFDNTSRVLVIGATNREDMLDEALLRPGRFERRIHVGLPDVKGRTAILEVHVKARNIALDENVNLSAVALRTPGMSGAELERVVNEAALLASHRDGDTVNAADMSSAVATVVMGRERTSRVMTEKDRMLTAWHEAGHTVAAMVLEHADDPVSVSIVPRGSAGGVTWLSGSEASYQSRQAAHASLIVSMAGRAAEEQLLDGEFTSGPHGDLAAATQLAYRMVTMFGMTDGRLVSFDSSVAPTHILATDTKTRKATEQLLAEALDSARNLLAQHRTLLAVVAQELLTHETLHTSDLQEMRTRAL